MSAFVISLKENGQLKYTYNSRRGKIILTSVKYPSKTAIEGAINFLKNNFDIVSIYKFRTPSGKYFFKLAIDNNIYAVSRKFTTELRLQKGIEEVQQKFTTSEILDFTVDIFAEKEIEEIEEEVIGF